MGSTQQGEGNDRDGVVETDGAATAHDELVQEALIAGRTHAEAGALVGRSAKWVQRRLGDPLFSSALALRRTARTAQALARLGDAIPAAIETMRQELQAEKSVDRLRAAALLVGSLGRLRPEDDDDVVVLRAEIAVLRDRLAHRKGA